MDSKFLVTSAHIISAWTTSTTGSKIELDSNHDIPNNSELDAVNIIKQNKLNCNNLSK